MSRPSNLCICICIAATAFTNFVAYGNAWQSMDSPILPRISGRISEPSHGCFDATYTRNDGTVMPVDASVHIIPHGAEKIAMVAVRER